MVREPPPLRAMRDEVWYLDARPVCLGLTVRGCCQAMAPTTSTGRCGARVWSVCLCMAVSRHSLGTWFHGLFLSDARLAHPDSWVHGL